MSTDDSSTKPSVDLTEAPPTTIVGILRRLGPGLIVAGSIVGSGELIATTATGAQAGIWLLWLILIGCLIKVFVQVEFGRYSLVGGVTTMDGLCQVPGPRIPGRGNWIVWYWFAMFLASLVQLGGIVGGVGQALAISAPITAEGRNYNGFAEAETQLTVARAELRLAEERGDQPRIDELLAEIYALEREAVRTLIIVRESREQDTTDLAALGTKLAGVEPPAFGVLASLRPIAQDSVALAKAEEALSDATGDTSALQEKVSELDGKVVSASATAVRREREIGVELVADYLAARAVDKPAAPLDDKLWATLITAITVVVLVMGRYGLIEGFSTALVGTFTLITIVNLFMLQSSPSWSISVSEIIDGMSFRLPPGGEQTKALATALATFGIIGVGASELIIYPYWCLEKGYARFTGERDESEAWADRARGWLRVMKWDAWCSMVVYTFATVAFYMLGAAILHRTQLDPKGAEMIRYLSVMYRPVFGTIAQTVFLFGAFAVLYSTFFVANASLSRVFSDVLRVMGFAKSGETAHRWRVRLLSGLLPIACCSFFWTGWEPQTAVLISGLMQAMMLPMLGIAALFFRYKRIDERVKPGIVWDFFLWVSAGGMLVAGVWAAWSKITS